MADDDAPVPSLTSGEIGSRFVTQTELDAANQKRDEAWKAAYARYEFIMLHLCLSIEPFTRLGQEPPQREEPVYDGRSLAEVCWMSFDCLWLYTYTWSYRNWLRIRHSNPPKCCDQSLTFL